MALGGTGPPSLRAAQPFILENRRERQKCVREIQTSGPPRTQTEFWLQGDHCHQVSAGLLKCRRAEARLAGRTRLRVRGEERGAAAALCPDGAPQPARAALGPHLERSGRAGAGQEAGAQARDGGLAPADVAGWSSPGRLQEEAEPRFGLSWQRRRPSGKAGGGGGGGGAGPSGNCSDSNQRRRRRHHLHLAPGPSPAPARPLLPAVLPCPPARYYHLMKSSCQQIYDKKYK